MNSSVQIISLYLLIFAVSVPQHYHSPSMEWSKADEYCLNNYQSVLNDALNCVIFLLTCCVTSDVNSTSLIENYYSQIIMCIINSCQKTIRYLDKGVSGSDNMICGWNEVADDEHKLATAAFLDSVAWVADVSVSTATYSKVQELVFMDSTGCLDMNSCKVFVLMTNCCASGLPLRLLITTSEAETALNAVLQLLQTLLLSDALFDR